MKAPPSTTSLAAVRRIDQLRGFLTSSQSTNAHGPPPPPPPTTPTTHTQISIGNTSLTVNPLSSLKHPEKVPLPSNQMLSNSLPQHFLHSLEFLIQKTKMGPQDVFLLGPPPSKSKRDLVADFLALTNREMEYISLHRDVSAESDLKQRREIVRDSSGNPSVEWNDSVVVQAAVNGRVLVIDGIERAERNVLTVLNNLLENREMDLEDGRHIIHPSRYDALLKTHTEAEMSALGLVRAHPDFQVIALGLPVPPFPGNPLDPPFRSRFQVRYIPFRATDTDIEAMRGVKDVIQAVNAVAAENNGNNTSSPKLASVGALLLPRVPETALDRVAALGAVFPLEARNPYALLDRVWPGSWFGKGLSGDQKKSLEGLVQNLGGHREKKGPQIQSTEYVLKGVQFDGRKGGRATFVESNRKSSSVTVPCVLGTRLQSPIPSKSYIETPRQSQLQTILAQCHVLNEIPCLVGATGSGKKTAISRFAETFGYDIETVHIYRDMTVRDLIARRGTRSDGSTCWQPSGLIQAAFTGKLAVLNGVEWLSGGAIASLQRFLEDGEVALPDGRNLMRHDTFDKVMQQCGFTEEVMNERGVFRMHPSFRVVVVANVPFVGNSAAGNGWLNEETSTMFHFVKVQEMEPEEEKAIVQARTNVPPEVLSKLLAFSHKYRNMSFGHHRNLTTRQLIRIASRVSATGCKEGDLYDSIWRECLAPFLPTLVRASMLDILRDVGINKSETYDGSLTITKTDSHLTIGNVSLPRYQIPPSDAESRSLIPTSDARAFFDNPLQTLVLKNMAVDFGMGEHLLLIGNQGTGKNKLTDYFLELLGRPREYMQLHRDTTVSSLTATPTVERGLLVLKDSPLLRAIKHGRVLIVDEADKAPVYITAALKSLIEQGEMALSDGRKIGGDGIQIHPDFRVIVLANRPGYPFMGNDFFGTIGEAFSCFPVENPDSVSERKLLEQAAPDVDKEVIERLVLSFGDLRKAFDDGLITYPFSLRELLAIVRHMQMFPHDSLGQTLRNVFDFDIHRQDMAILLKQVFAKHGLNIEGLNDIWNSEVDRRTGTLTIKREEVDATKAPASIVDPKEGKIDPKNEPHVGGNTWKGGTGGSSTAGLGGRGGPYRLDAGHKVHQLSDEEKAKVPKHVLEAARKMGQDALKKRLEEIKMNSYEAELYSQIFDAVKGDIQRLKVILEGAKAKEKERVWNKNQVIGELDDTKLVEGIIGETAIYKTRGNEVQDFGLVQKKPKRVKIVFDVSGSMYRFNGLDGRLNRSLETALLIMASMDNSLRSKFVYDVVGHSGDSPCIPLVDKGKPPQNEMDQMKVLQNMNANAQFCWSGDNTVNALQRAITDLAKEADEADESHVILLSDANLRRYGITASELGRVMESNERVNAAVVFIGSLGNEAAKLVSELPRGKAFLAMDTSKIPSIMKELFSAIVN